MIHHGARTQARSSTGAIRFLYFLLEWNYDLRVNHRCKTFLERVLHARCRNARTPIQPIATIPFRTQLGNFLERQISSKKYVATSVLLLSSCDKSKEKIEHASMEYYASHVTVTRKRHRTTIASMTVRTKEKYEKYAARRSLVALLAQLRFIFTVSVATPERFLQSHLIANYATRLRCYFNNSTRKLYQKTLNFRTSSADFSWRNLPSDPR